MKRNFKKVLCLLLTLLLVFPLGTGAYADYVTDNNYFRISCTVNGNTQSSRGFCWYTKEDCDSAVLIMKNGVDISAKLQFTDSCEEWEGYYMHKVTVSGLSADTTYTYKVGDGKTWSDVGTFTTDDGDSNVNILVYADVQASSLNNFLVGARAVNAGLNSSAAPFDLMINLGDFTNDSTNEEWNYYAEAFDSICLNNTLAPVSGNHDGLGCPHWFNNMFNLDTSESVQVNDGVNYSFDYGNTHIAVLNTNDILSISQAQLKWLENDMNKTNKDWKIVSMHKTPYTLGKDGKWPDAMYLQQALTAVCDKTGVDLIISGHDHQYLRTKSLTGNEVKEGGATYVLCGTAGSKRYQVRPFAVNNFTPMEFINTMVSQRDGKYFNGKDFDSQKDLYIGSCYNTITVNGGKLTFDSYIITDESEENPEGTVTQIDSFTLSKEVGKNVPTFTGDNTTSKLSYGLNSIASVLNLLVYAFGTWLPKFIKAAPDIIKSYITDGTF